MIDVITARRKAIQDAAPCNGCGATLADCNAHQGKDPNAPEWFGCCARGSDMRPCRHTVDSHALSNLLKEIESGTVRTVEEATPKKTVREPRGPGMTWVEYLDQDTQWKPNKKPMVAIADMDETWRFNASRWLERNAAKFAAKLAEETYLLVCTDRMSERTADQFHNEAEQAQANPAAWIRTTPLYQALVAELPTKPKKLAALAERARHYSTCPARESGDDDACDCMQPAPEWTL